MKYHTQKAANQRVKRIVRKTAEKFRKRRVAKSLRALNSLKMRYVRPDEDDHL